MMSAHTQGKVCAAVAGVPNAETTGYVLHHCIIMPGTNHVVALTGRTDTGDKNFDATSEADAVRLAACWNAFEGIETKDIARCHVVGKPIEAGKWSQLEKSMRVFGAHAAFDQFIDNRVNRKFLGLNNREINCLAILHILRGYPTLGGVRTLISSIERILQIKNGGAK